MSDKIKPSKSTLREALELSEEILKNIELNEIPLANIALKTARLARLLNDFDYQKIMELEASGYPSTPDGVQPEIYNLAVLAGREYLQKDTKTGEINKYIYTTSIEELELEVKILDIALTSARDPDVSVSSANPDQVVWNPTGNTFERSTIRNNAARAQRKLSSRRSFIYSYVLRRNYELKFSNISDDIFSRVRVKVDEFIGVHIPDAINKLSAIYENLKSENSEDWSNAVHGCRRLLKALADAIYPAREDVVKKVDGSEKIIKLGPNNYVNRLICFLEERSKSQNFNKIVGSHLKFIGDRLDSIVSASSKGTHSNIVTREEAERYVIYTYLIMGDILTLVED